MEVQQEIEDLYYFVPEVALHFTIIDKIGEGQNLYIFSLSLSLSLSLSVPLYFAWLLLSLFYISGCFSIFFFFHFLSFFGIL